MTAPSLIINSPYEVPRQHWQQARDGSLTLTPERRPAGYEIFDARHNTRRTETLDLVNSIRGRVDEWRKACYPGVTSVTRRLLEHWNDRDARQFPFYFCQLEAMDTLIWLVEASPEYKQGIHVPGDGGAWQRLCNKMATGTGKTTVMAMIITWQVLNSLTYPKRNKDFSRAVFIVAPGITVKERLRVLYPGELDNFYDYFDLCPSEALRQKLNQVELLIENWHSLMPLKQTDRSVVKKGAESDEAFTRRVLGKLAVQRDLVIINDEAHHAYRIPAELKISKKQAAEQGSIWMRPLAGLRDWTASTKPDGFNAASIFPPPPLRLPVKPVARRVCLTGLFPTSVSMTPSKRVWSRRRGSLSVTMPFPIPKPTAPSSIIFTVILRWPTI